SGEPRVDPVGHLLEERVAIREVPVGRGHRDPGARRDAPYRQLLAARLGDEIDPRLEELLAGAVHLLRAERAFIRAVSSAGGHPGLSVSLGGAASVSPPRERSRCILTIDDTSCLMKKQIVSQCAGGCL